MPILKWPQGGEKRICKRGQGLSLQSVPSSEGHTALLQETNVPFGLVSSFPHEQKCLLQGVVRVSDGICLFRTSPQFRMLRSEDQGAHYLVTGHCECFSESPWSCGCFGQTLR